MPNPDKFDSGLPKTPPRVQAPVAKAASSNGKKKPVSLLGTLSIYAFKVPASQVDAALGITRHGES